MNRLLYPCMSKHALYFNRLIFRLFSLFYLSLGLVLVGTVVVFINLIAFVLDIK